MMGNEEREKILTHKLAMQILVSICGFEFLLFEQGSF